MLGTWEWRLVRGDIRQCVDLAAEGMTLADRLADPGMLDGSVVHARRHDVLPGGVRRRATVLRESAGHLRRPRAHEVLVRVHGAQRRRDASLLSRPGAVAPRLPGSGHEAGSRDARARPHDRPRVHHRSRPGFHGVSLPVLPARQRSRGGRRGRDRDRHGSGVSALARAGDASQGRGIAAAAAAETTRYRSFSMA